MRQRDLNLNDYRISRNAYRELKYFCLQYGEKKEKLQHIRQLRPITYDGMPTASGPSDPTEQKALAASRLAEDCEQIEQCAIAAASAGLYRYLLDNVTRGTSIRYLDAPCGERQFNELRRKFFFLLARRRGMA